MNNGEPHRARSRKARKNVLYSNSLIGIIRAILTVHISPDSNKCKLQIRKDLAVKLYEILMLNWFSEENAVKYSGKIKNEIERLLNLQSFFIRTDSEYDYRKEYRKNHWGGRCRHRILG